MRAPRPRLSSISAVTAGDGRWYGEQGTPPRPVEVDHADGCRGISGVPMAMSRRPVRGQPDHRCHPFFQFFRRIATVFRRAAGCSVKAGRVLLKRSDRTPDRPHRRRSFVNQHERQAFNSTLVAPDVSHAACVWRMHGRMHFRHGGTALAVPPRGDHGGRRL